MAGLNIKRDILFRVGLAFFGALVFCFAIGAKIVYLQQVEGATWRDRAKRQQVKTRTIPATRGSIFAGDGSLLATSLPYYRLGMDLNVPLRSALDSTLFIKNLDSLSTRLSKLFGNQSKQAYKTDLREAVTALRTARRQNKKLKGNDRVPERTYLLLGNRLVTFEERQSIGDWPRLRAKARKRKSRFNKEKAGYDYVWTTIDSVGRFRTGLGFETVLVRTNPFGNMAARSIGKTANVRDTIDHTVELMRGKTGLEARFNDVLMGRNGLGLFENLGNGSWRALSDDDATRPTPGVDVHTTLDITLQDIAESVLRRSVQHYRAKYGSVIVMEVATGEVKAMTNLSLVRERDSLYVDDFNYAVSRHNEPGSTFKLPSMVAVLEANPTLSPERMIHIGTSGGWRYRTRVIHDSHASAWASLSVQNVFVHSSNIGTVKLVLEAFERRPAEYIRYLDRFHLTQPTGFQVEREAKPVVYRPGQPGGWSGLSLSSMAFGHELEITPLQMLAFYNGIANNGYWVQPLIVKYTKRADEIVEDFTKKQVRDDVPLCSDRTLRIVKQMLRQVVDDPHGTAKRIKNPHYAIAGKTGTTKKIINGRYSTRYYSSFIGYFPADKPKYSCLVVIDDPRERDGRTIMGGEAAAPVFKEVADKIHAADLRLHRPLHQVDSSGLFPDAHLTASLSKDAALLGTQWHRRAAGRSLPSDNRVPDVAGMSLRDALYVLENRGYRVSYTGQGRVAKQSLPAGEVPVGKKAIRLELK
jgi:cell division protein FtsI (penicillin-binding protein 3)